MSLNISLSDLLVKARELASDPNTAQSALHTIMMSDDPLNPFIEVRPLIWAFFGGNPFNSPAEKLPLAIEYLKRLIAVEAKVAAGILTDPYPFAIEFMDMAGSHMFQYRSLQKVEADCEKLREQVVSFQNRIAELEAQLATSTDSDPS